MFLRVAMVVVLALSVLGLGAVAFMAMSKPAPVVAAGPAAPPPPPKPSRMILTAARTLRAGALIKADDLVPQSAGDAAPADALVDSPAMRATLSGALVHRAIQANQPIQPDDFIRVGDRGFLAAVLKPGMRAVAVGVDSVAGLAGLVWPGDYVDLVLVQQADGEGTAPGHRMSGETVLHNLRVVAVDQSLVQGGADAAAPSAGVQQTRTVTLEASPRDVERVAVASRLGHLSLSVVSIDEQPEPAETGEAAAPPFIAGVMPTSAVPPVGVSAIPPAKSAPTPSTVIWAGDVSSALNGRPAKAGGPALLVYDGAGEGKEVHFR